MTDKRTLQHRKKDHLLRTEIRREPRVDIDTLLNAKGERIDLSKRRKKERESDIVSDILEDDLDVLLNPNVEEERQKKKRKSHRQKRRQLVYDEEFGTIVVKRRHKGRRNGEWDDLDLEL